MAYEKYIKKDGKLYGPYLYQSKRVDGKVVSEYQGQKKLSLGKFAWIIPVALVIIFGAYLIGQGHGSSTGHAILNLNANYQEGKTLDGQLKISLNQGELIPASSNVVFENGGQTYQYPLSSLVSEQTSQGNYFVNGQNIGGSGDGFGLAGTKTVYPDIQFTLIISSTNSSEVSSSGTENTTPTENSTPAENSPLTTQDNNSNGTGLIGVVANFFLGLTPTGHAVVQFQNEVTGNVSWNQTFTYTLQPGEIAEIKPTSVHTDSGQQLPDNTISLTTNGNIVSVTSSYSTQEQGFGSDFTGTDTKDISINLNQLNLSSLQQGPMHVGILYNGQEIVSIDTDLSQGGVTGTSPQTPTSNETNIIPQENTTPIITQNLVLTDAEKNTLINEFGNISVQVTEAQALNGFIVVRYEIGTYWIENSYPSNLDNATLNSLMGEDRIKFLKDIAASLSQQNPSAQNVSGLYGNYNY
ncbi:MAG: hypothetical protein ABSG05_02720 [Candidatus Pacearchaeota archaeon]|jgi:hypothetical protein